jgi:hypothetical protein
MCVGMRRWCVTHRSHGERDVAPGVRLEAGEDQEQKEGAVGDEPDGLEREDGPAAVTRDVGRGHWRGDAARPACHRVDGLGGERDERRRGDVGRDDARLERRLPAPFRSAWLGAGDAPRRHAPELARRGQGMGAGRGKRWVAAEEGVVSRRAQAVESEDSAKLSARG